MPLFLIASIGEFISETIGNVLFKLYNILGYASPNLKVVWHLWQGVECYEVNAAEGIEAQCRKVLKFAPNFNHVSSFIEVSVTPNGNVLKLRQACKCFALVSSIMSLTVYKKNEALRPWSCSYSHVQIVILISVRKHNVTQMTGSRKN